MTTLRIADRWFERRTLGDGVTWLWEPHAHPLIRCNIWHVQGKTQDLLVDTGLGLVSLSEEIADLVDKPLVTVATHAHFDHVGSLFEFEARLMHAAEAAMMDPFDDLATLVTAEIPERMLQDLASAGYPIDESELISALPKAGYDPGTYRIHATAATELVSEGQVIDLGNRHFEVLHLPGHSPGSIGLWESATGTLFSGDAIYDGPLLDELPESNIVDYIKTMKRLRELPVSIVHGGHEPSFGRDRFVELATMYLETRDV